VTDDPTSCPARPEAATPVEALASGFDTEATALLGELPMSGADSHPAGRANGLLDAAREVRERLVPAWAALTAENDRLRTAGAEMLAYIEADDNRAPSITIPVTLACWREAVGGAPGA
jgi:hypothetical protein